MYYVYILGSRKDNGFYIGYTKNLQRRFYQHNLGLSTSTRNRRPFELLAYEAFNNSNDAKAREKYLKSGHGREQLKNKLKVTFEVFLKKVDTLP